MRAHVSKWGNSLGLRIPHSIAEQLGISESTPVELTVENNHLVVQKVYTLESMLAQVKPENIHSEIETGPAVGGEVW